MTENPAQLEGAPLTETTAIIAAAVMSVGPMSDQNAWEQAVTDRAKEVAQFASPMIRNENAVVSVPSA